MILTVMEAKEYLRVEHIEEDELIGQMILSAERLCMDILRTDNPADLENDPNARIAVLYTLAYLYEHREEADHHALTLSLRALLEGSRKAGF